MSSKVLIIGGSRFLGAEIANVFSDRCEYEVHVLNRGSRPAANNKVSQIICDIKDRDSFSNILKQNYWDIVIDTILNDEDLKFVVSELKDNVGRFIHTGSIGVYGDARQIPASESLPILEYEGDEIVFNYKIKQDQVLMRAFHEQGFPVTILRMSYIYGIGDIPLDGWGGRSKEFFKMLQESAPVTLPENGRALLHPGHVKDLARSFLCAAETPESVGQIYNIGGSHALMIKDYVRMIASLLNSKSDIKYAQLKDVCDMYPEITNERGMKFSCQHMCASIAKAGKELNWKPEISLLNGLRENVEWMRQQNII